VQLARDSRPLGRQHVVDVGGLQEDRGLAHKLAVGIDDVLNRGMVALQDTTVELIKSNW
jgi:hypothetical protein